MRGFARLRRTVLMATAALLSPLLSACVTLGQPPDPAATHPIPPFTIPPAQPGETYLRCVVFGDMGTGHDDQRVVAAAMAARAKADGVDFLLTTGDNFYPNGVESVEDPQWTTKLEDIYADPALDVPVYPTLGNHDHHGSTKAQVDYSVRNPNWRMPAAYYTFTKTLADDVTVQFFAIDTTPIIMPLMPQEAQVDWLDEELGKSTARWKIVFGHHPVYSHGLHGDSAGMKKHVEPLLIKHAVDLYLCGHDHTLELLKPVQGVHYVVSGAGGGPDKAYGVQWTDESIYAATLGGFVALRIGANELVIEFVRPDGRTEYAHVLRK